MNLLLKKMSHGWVVLRLLKYRASRFGSATQVEADHLPPVGKGARREKAGISDEDMRKLGEQLGERSDRTATQVTPLDVEAAVERALK